MNKIRWSNPALTVPEHQFQCRAWLQYADDSEEESEEELNKNYRWANPALTVPEHQFQCGVVSYSSNLQSANVQSANIQSADDSEEESDEESTAVKRCNHGTTKKRNESTTVKHCNQGINKKRTHSTTASKESTATIVKRCKPSTDRRRSPPLPPSSSQGEAKYDFKRPGLANHKANLRAEEMVRDHYVKKINHHGMDAVREEHMLRSDPSQYHELHLQILSDPTFQHYSKSDPSSSHLTVKWLNERHEIALASLEMQA